MTAVTIDVPDGYVAVIAKAATCHPDRVANARGLCKSCYQIAWLNGRHQMHPTGKGGAIRSTADFAADYALLRSEGHTRHQIADRIGMKYAALNAAYRRAVRKGLITPDRRTS